MAGPGPAAFVSRDDLTDDQDVLPGGQKRCTAQRTDKSGRCAKPAILGSNVCTHHGGSASQVVAKAKERLAEMAPAAVGTLGQLMVGRDREGRQVPHAVMKSAADSVLDRVGVPRRSAVEVNQHEEAQAGLVDALARLHALRRGEDGEPIPPAIPLGPATGREQAAALLSAAAKIDAWRDEHDEGWRERLDEARRQAEAERREQAEQDAIEHLRRAAHRAIEAPRPDPAAMPDFPTDVE